MIEKEEETYSLTLRRVRQRTIDALYERKALTGKPICRLVDEIITAHFEVRRFVVELSAK